VHVISRKALRDFWERHPESQGPLERWFRIVRQTDFASFAELRRTFPSADLVGDLVVFNIAGNHYRLIASVHINRRKLYIRSVLTHREYDQGRWKV
jgi:mRNA interferase HigB